MNTYIVLFRGINVGGKHRLSMKELVSAMQQSGAERVRTYIQSGNVVYSGDPESAKKAAALVEEQHGFRPEVLVLDAGAFQSAVENNPFREAEGKTVHFSFCKSAPESADTERLMGLKSETERFEIHGNVFYLFAPEGIGRSKLAANVESCLGVPSTSRNLNTVNKLLEMVQQQP